jgi:tetratricopeptide (TPR) repeat protein
MTRKEQLLTTLKETPTDKAALDNLLAFFVQRGDFEGLYSALTEVVDHLVTPESLAVFHGRVRDVLRKHLELAPDPMVEAGLKVRIARQMFEQGEDPGQALVYMTEALERMQSEEAAQKAAELLRDGKQHLLLLSLLEHKAQGEISPERKGDSLIQFGYAALAARYVARAEEAFSALDGGLEALREKAEEGLRLVDRARTELEQEAERLEGAQSSGTDAERLVAREALGRVYIRLGRTEQGIALLEEVLDRSKSQSVFMELFLSYKELGQWERVVALVEEWLETTEDELSRKELLKERARIHAVHLGDPSLASQALAALYDLFPGVPDVVDFCVNILGELEDHVAMADFLTRARQDTSDRDQERRFLEWEAALRWRKLNDVEQAEKLYRRIKSIDPRNEASLIFYEELYRNEGNHRKLYSVLTTRQSLVPDLQKIDILKEMARVSRDHLESPERAIDALRKVLALEPDDREAFEELGQLLESSGRWHAVVEHYSGRADRLDAEATAEKLGLLRRVRGIYQDSGKLPVPEMVVNIDRKILQVDPHNRVALAALQEFYRKNNRWSELAEVLERVVEVETDRKRILEIHTEIARICIEVQHQEAAAIPHLEKVVELNPKELSALGLLSKAYRARGNIEGFLQVGKRQLALARPSEKKALLEDLASVSLEGTEQSGLAAELLEELYSLEPDHPWAFRRLRKVYEQSESHEELANLYARHLKATKVDSARRELKEKLGILFADKLDRLEEARGLFQELLDENPTHRQARRYLQNILAQAGEFEQLESIFREAKNLPGMLRFLDEYREKETRPDRIRRAGLEMVRIAAEELKDSNRATQILESLLAQLPTDVDIARSLLDRLGPEGPAGSIAAALAVIADHGGDQEAAHASLQLASALDDSGDTQGAYGRTLCLFLDQIETGECGLLGLLKDRATRADELSNLAETLAELTTRSLPAGLLPTLSVEAAEIFGRHLKSYDRAERVLTEALNIEPDSIEILEELERIYSAGGNWDAYEATVRAKANLLLDVQARTEELFKLARLYEEIVQDLGRAGDVYREVLSLDPSNAEASQGIRRILEELERFDELVPLLEEELNLLPGMEGRALILDLARMYLTRLDSPDRAAEYLERALHLIPGDEEAWELVEEMVQQELGLDILLPLLEQRFETEGRFDDLISVLDRKAGRAESETDRLSLLDRCARVMLEDLNRPAGAFQYLCRMVSLDSCDPKVVSRLDDMGRQAGEEEALFEVYRGLLGMPEARFSPVNPLETSSELDVSRRLASLAIDLGRDEIAVDALGKARQWAPSDLGLVDTLAGLLERTGQHEPLLELLEEKLELTTEPAVRKDIVWRVADLLAVHLGREEDSIPWVQQGWSCDPDNTEFMDRLEQLFLSYERFEDLIGLWQHKKTLVSGRELATLHYQLAVLYRDALSDLDLAFLNLKEALELDPENDACLEAMAAMLSMTAAEGYASAARGIIEVLEPVSRLREEWGRLAEVLTVKAQHSQNSEERGESLYDLGLVYLEQLDQTEKALTAFKASVVETPGNVERLRQLISLCHELGRRTDLIEALEAGLGDVESSDIVAGLAAYAAALRDESGRQEDAATVYLRLVALVPENMDYYWALDELYGELDQPMKRIETLSDAVEYLEGEEQARTLVRVAELWIEQATPGEAISVLHRAMGMAALMDEETRGLSFHLLLNALEAEESWFEVSQILRQQLEFTADNHERKAVLYRAALLEEEKLDNPDGALEKYRSIVELDGEDREAVAAMTRLLEATARFRELEELLHGQTVSRHDAEERKDLLLHLARVRFESLGEPDAALDAVAVLVEEDLGGEVAVQLLRSIVDTAPDSGYRASGILEQIYAKSEDRDALVDLYRFQIEEYPQDVDAVELYRRLAGLYESHFHDLTKALDAVCQAFRLEPGSQVIHEQMLRYARETGGFEALFDVYVDVLSNQEDGRARNGLRRKMAGIYHDELGDLGHSEFIYRDMLDDEPDNAFALERLEGLYRETRNWERLVDVLRSRLMVTRSDGGRVTVLFAIAAVYRDELQEMAEALDVFEEILALDPRQWNAYRSIEGIQLGRGDVEGVIATLRRELRYHDSDEECREIQLKVAGLLFRELKDYEGAVEEIRKVLSGFPDFGEAVALLQELVQGWDSPSLEAVELLEDRYRQAGDWEAIVDLYQHSANGALSREQKLEWMEKIYAVRTEEQLNSVGAYALCKNALLLVPDDEQWLTRLVQQAVSANRSQDLVDFLSGRVLDEGVAGEGIEPQYHYVLGEFLSDVMQDPEEGRNCFERAVRYGPSAWSTPARLRLKDLYAALEQWSAYVVVLEELANDELGPGRRDLLLDAARVNRENLNELDRAQALLTDLSKEYPGDEDVLNALEQLLVERENVPELEMLLRHRCDGESSLEGRAEIRFRLGNLLLSQPDRLTEGVQELLANVEEDAHIEPTWNVLESLLDSEEVPADTRVELAGPLADSLEAHGDAKRMRHVLEVLLSLVSEEAEANRLHLRLAGQYRQEGDFGQEFVHLGQSLRLFPGMREVEELLDEVVAKTSAWMEYRQLLLDSSESAEVDSIRIRYLLKAADIAAQDLDDTALAADSHEKVLALDEFNLQSLSFLVGYFRDQGVKSRVAELLEKQVAVLSDAGVRQDKMVELGRLLMDDLQDFGSARRWWEELRHDAACRQEAYQRLKTLAEQARDFEALSDLLLEQQDQAESKEARAMLCRQLGHLYEDRLANLSEALQWYERGSKETPGDPDALQGARRCAMKVEDWDAAVQADEALLELVSAQQAPGLQLELAGILLERLVRKEEGLAYLQTALQARPAVSGAVQLAQRLLQDPDVGFQLSLMLEPVLEEALEYEALVALFKVQLEHIESQEERTPVQIRLAEVLSSHLARGEEALEVLAGLLPSPAGTEQILDKMEHIAGRHALWAALGSRWQQVMEVLDDPPTRVLLALRLGALCRDVLSNLDDAVRWFRLVQEEEPGHESAVEALEGLFRDLERYEELANLYEEVLLDARDALRVPWLLKWAFLKEGYLSDLVGSIQAYREVLTLDPDNLAALNRLDVMLENPVLGLAAIETLEPIYRQKDDDQRLARLLKAKASEVEGNLDRATLLAEAAGRLNRVEGGQEEAFQTYLTAILEKNFDPEVVLSGAGDLAEELDLWQELTEAMETAAQDNPHEELRLELWRRLALIYVEKLDWLDQGEAKLNLVLSDVPDNSFALHLLSRVLDGKGDVLGRISVLERLGDSTLDSRQGEELFLEAADLALELSRVEEASRLLAKALKRAPDNLELMERLGGTYRLLERWDELVELLESQSCLQEEEGRKPLLMEAAYLALDRLGDPSRALSMARGVLEREPSDLQALQFVASILRSQGRLQELLLTLERMLGQLTGGNRLETLFELTRISRDLEDIDGALSYVDQVLDDAPEHEEAQAIRVELLKSSNDLNSLVSMYEERAERETEPVRKTDQLLKAVDLLLNELADPDAAMEVLHKVREVVPDHHGALDRQARIAVQLKEYAQAVEYLEERSRLEPPPEVRGETLRQAAEIAADKLRDLELAEMYAREAFDAAPENPAVVDLLARVLDGLQHHEALSELLIHRLDVTTEPSMRSLLARKLAGIRGDHLQDSEGFFRWMTEAHQLQGDLETADLLIEYHRGQQNESEVRDLVSWKISFLTAGNRLTEVPELLVQLGDMYMEQGESDEALSTYQRSVQMDAAFLPGAFRLAKLLATMPEMADEAISLYQKLLLRINEFESLEDKTDVYYHLALLFRAKGDAKRAKGYLARLLSLDRNHESGLELKKELDS